MADSSNKQTSPNWIVMQPIFRRFSELLCLVMLLVVGGKPAIAEPVQPPNLVYILVDELGYYEPGFMGGTTIQTPNLDRMAGEGIIFRNLFAGSSVCAPTRCSLLTGKHTGHSSIRGNGGGVPLRSDETTIASMLKPRGYATGGYGKWGCGGRGSTGVPENHGFDVFLGYYDQIHAHTYYPPYLIRNSEEVPLAGNHGDPYGNDEVKPKSETYSQYVIHDAAVEFVREHADEPFFLYLPYTPPHGTFDIPDSDPAWAMYKDKPWTEDARRYAAMTTMLDRQVGELLDLLKERGIDENTLVFFSGDNGGDDYFASDEHPRGIHSANKDPITGVEYRGTKRTVYEGGIRIPAIARWPGKISPGSVSDLLCYFPDIMPTFAEVTGTTAPADTDGISLVPELLGAGAAGRKQSKHPFLYWECGDGQAIRRGTWRAVKLNKKSDWELFDLATDPSESHDVGESHTKILAELMALAELSHQPTSIGTFTHTDLHERDRKAKYGRHNDTDWKFRWPKKNSH